MYECHLMPSLVHQLLFWEATLFYWDMNIQLFIFTPNEGEDYSPVKKMRLLKWKGEDVAVLEAAKSCLLLLVVGCLYLVPFQLEQKKQGLYI